MASGTIQDPMVGMIEGTLTLNPDTDVTPTTSTKVRRIGRIGILTLIALVPVTTGSKQRIIYTNSSIKPAFNISRNIVFENDGGAMVGGYANFNTSGQVDITSLGNITSSACYIREQFIFFCA